MSRPAAWGLAPRVARRMREGPEGRRWFGKKRPPVARIRRSRKDCVASVLLSSGKHQVGGSAATTGKARGRPDLPTSVNSRRAGALSLLNQDWRGPAGGDPAGPCQSWSNREKPLPLPNCRWRGPVHRIPGRPIGHLGGSHPTRPTDGPSETPARLRAARRPDSCQRRSSRGDPCRCAHMRQALAGTNVLHPKHPGQLVRNLSGS